VRYRDNSAAHSLVSRNSLTLYIYINYFDGIGSTGVARSSEICGIGLILPSIINYNKL